MDWSKAKNVIIVALLMLNVFLAAMYLNQLHDGNSKENGDVRSYMMGILDDRGVEVDCEIPEEPEGMSSLSIRYSNAETEDVRKQIDGAIPLDAAHMNEEDYKKAADTFIRSCSFEDDQKGEGSVTEEEDGSVTVSYRNYYNDIPLEECYMKVIFTDGKITEFHRHWMQAQEQGDTEIDVMDPIQAVLTATEEETTGTDSSSDTSSDEAVSADDVNDYRIEDISLVYWASPLESDQELLYDTAFPAWMITYNGGKVRFISTIEQ